MRLPRESTNQVAWTGVANLIFEAHIIAKHSALYFALGSVSMSSSPTRIVITIWICFLVSIAISVLLSDSYKPCSSVDVYT